MLTNKFRDTDNETFFMVNNFSFDNIGILANKIISAKQAIPTLI